jgi:diguanylate cyclase (GGDEF)-like protein/PAS domain S-box-containing protein
MAECQLPPSSRSNPPPLADVRGGFATSAWIGLVAAAVGALVLLGWAFDNPALTGEFPGSVYMEANTAVCFILAGIALTLRARRGSWASGAAVACAAGTALVGILTMAEHVLPINLGLDQLLFVAPPAAGGTLPPGRMCLTAALTFILLGTQLILAGSRRFLPTAQRLALLSGLLGMLSFLGHLYGAAEHYGLGQYTQTAVHTCLLFILLSLGTLLLHPSDGLLRTLAARSMGGWLLRWMTPFVIAGPILLGWLRVEGERLGLFEGPLGVAIMMVTIMLLSTVLVLWAARILTRMEQARCRSEDDLRRASQSLRQLSQVVEQTPAAVVITDTTGAIEYVNPAFTRLTGYTADEARGQNPRLLKSGLTPPETYADMWRQLSAGHEWRGELYNRAKNGDLFWELATISPLRDPDGKTSHYVAVKENITDRKQMEDELRTAARTDKLTGLPNRALFHDRLEQAVLRAQRLRDYRFALLFLDIDRFKLINDSLGHDVGDLLLQEISRRLRTAVRASDSLTGLVQDHTTARLGGDEFVVLLDAVGRPDDAAIVARRLLDVLAQPYQLREHDVYSSASIGIVTSDAAALSADQLLRDADTAMYEAKLAGKGRYAVFSPPMRDRVRNRLNLENDLRKALEDRQFSLVYEPIASLLTGQIERFEVLVRWHHPQRGAVSPAEFIPVAEETGLILPLGEWVLRTACTQFARWIADLGDDAPPSLSVNLARSQLLLPSLPDTIRQILDQTGVPPSRLHLEVTESEVMKDVATATRTLQAIKAIGVKIDMDDFGTGYSSLACLHQFPLDVIKIDRSFTANIERGRDFAALVHAVADLARNLNIQVVAEGVETVDQAVILQSLDCEFGQGYYFGKPLPAEKVAQLRGHVGPHHEALAETSGS